MNTEERDDKVNHLLHDADRAEAGASFADRIRHLGPDHAKHARELREKAARLRREAEEIDPKHESHWWEQGE